MLHLLDFVLHAQYGLHVVLHLLEQELVVGFFEPGKRQSLKNFVDRFEGAVLTVLLVPGLGHLVLEQLPVFEHLLLVGHADIIQI